MVVVRDRNLVADVGLDIGQRDRVLLATEADGVAVGAGARGAADAVHVVGRILRQVEIEHVADIGNVQAARGDVGGDQHRELALVELAQEAQPLGLRHVARDRLGVEAVGTQRSLEALGHALGVDEHHGAVRLAFAQQVHQQRNLLRHGREVDRLAHAVDRHLVGLDAHQLRVVHVLVGELEHALRERRREQHRLALVGRRQAPQDVADVGDEAEVEHAVSLVEHHHLAVTQVVHALLEVIDDAARRADQHLDAVGQLAPLFFVIGAAEDHGLLEAGMAADDFGILVDLHREFAGRRDHQCAHRSRRPVRRCRPGQQRLIKRHQECRGLAGAGLGLAGDVATGECGRQGLGLDRRAPGKARLNDPLHHRGLQRQGTEGQGA